jgi:hypothetical protein
LIFLAAFIFILPANAQDWKVVNYSDPDLIKESGLTIEEFNSLTQKDWLRLFDNKNKVNFAFQAIDSKGKDITNDKNQSINIEIKGLSGDQLVNFKNISTQTEVEETIVNNYVLSLDGINNYVKTPSIFLNLPVTLIVEIKSNNLNRIMGILDGNGSANLDYYQDEFGYPYFYTTNTDGSRIVLKSNTSLSLNSFSYLTIVLDNNSRKFYLNDILVASDYKTSNPLTLYRIGTSYNNNFYVWDGYLDNVQFWNIALTKEEIQNKINNKPIGNEDGLVAYYDMEEGIGNTLIDKAGNNDGTIYGADYVLKE